MKLVCIVIGVAVAVLIVVMVLCLTKSKVNKCSTGTSECELRRVDHRQKQYQYILTVGCFDRLHKGHINILSKMKTMGNRLVLGIHDNESTQKLKNTSDIQPLHVREKNVRKYADDVFHIKDTDPTNDLKRYLKSNPEIQNVCFVRADDNIDFPGKSFVQSKMPITFLPYTRGISATKLRQKNEKVSITNRLLVMVRNILQEHGIPYYLHFLVQ